MSFQTKKNKLFQALRQAELYQIFKITEDTNSVFLQAQQNIKNGRCVISIDLDDRVFNAIHYFLGNLENPGKKQKMLDLLNELNKTSLMTKYYLDDNDSIMARVTYIIPNDDFDGSFFVSLITNAFNNIADSHYQQIMRLVWA